MRDIPAFSSPTSLTSSSKDKPDWKKKKIMFGLENTRIILYIDVCIVSIAFGVHV